MKQKIDKNSKFAHYFYDQNKYKITKCNEVYKGYLEEKTYRLQCNIKQVCNTWT